MADWQIQASPAIVAAVILALGGASWLAWRHLRDGGLGWRQRVMEGIRFVAILLICVTLLRPERVTELKRDRNPELVVLLDDTGSMATRDLGTPEAPMTRREWINQVRQSAPWFSLDGVYDITVESIGETGPARVATAESGSSASATSPETAPDSTTLSPDPAPADARPDGGGTDLNAALQRVQSSYKHLRAVLLLSDGHWNIGESPVGAATQLRLQGTPVYTVAVGRDTYLPDLVLEEVKAPAFGLLGERIAIPFRVVNHLDRDQRVPVVLLDGGREVARKEIVVPAGQGVHNSLIWNAAELGDRTMSITVPVLPGEVDTGNNSREFHIAIRRETLRVLIVESLPRWEFRFLRNALMRDPGVDVDCLLLHPEIGVASGPTYIPAFPSTIQEISKYDVIFLGDVGVGGNELTNEQLELIKGVVSQQGSGLVFLPGPRGRQLTFAKSPLADLLPVTLDTAHPEGVSFPKPSRLILTQLGEDHLLTMLAESPAANRQLWQRLPGFYWNAAVLKARPGSDVLAVHETYRNDNGRIPLLVTRPFGSGYTLFMGTDSAWRWRKGVEDTYHYRFWGQVVRWMAHPRHLAHDQRVRLIYSPENPRRGDTVFLQATVLDASGFPIRDGEVNATIKADDGRVEHLRLAPSPGDWGVHTGRFTPDLAGDWQITLDAVGKGRLLETVIKVGDRDVEVVGQPARSNVLREIASLSNGAYTDHTGLDALLAQLKALPESDHQQIRFRLWAQWWWGLAIVLVLSALWISRKLWGLT